MQNNDFWLLRGEFAAIRVAFLPALASCAVSDSPCSCEFQVPFGRSRPRFNVMLWVSAMHVVSG